MVGGLDVGIVGGVESLDEDAAGAFRIGVDDLNGLERECWIAGNDVGLWHQMVFTVVIFEGKIWQGESVLTTLQGEGFEVAVEALAIACFDEEIGHRNAVKVSGCKRWLKWIFLDVKKCLQIAEGGGFAFAIGMDAAHGNGFGVAPHVLQGGLLVKGGSVGGELASGEVTLAELVQHRENAHHLRGQIEEYFARPAGDRVAGIFEVFQNLVGRLGGGAEDLFHGKRAASGWAVLVKYFHREPCEVGGEGL